MKSHTRECSNVVNCAVFTGRYAEQAYLETEKKTKFNSQVNSCANKFSVIINPRVISTGIEIKMQGFVGSKVQ